MKRETTKLTKLDYAKQITAALYNMKELPSADHHHVRKLISAKKSDLEESAELARTILAQRKHS